MCTTLVCVLFVATTMYTISMYYLVCTTLVCVLFVATTMYTISMYYLVCTTLVCVYLLLYAVLVSTLLLFGSLSVLAEERRVPVQLPLIGGRNNKQFFSAPLISSRIV